MGSHRARIKRITLSGWRRYRVKPELLLIFSVTVSVFQPSVYPERTRASTVMSRPFGFATSSARSQLQTSRAFIVISLASDGLRVRLSVSAPSGPSIYWALLSIVSAKAEHVLRSLRYGDRLGVKPEHILRATAPPDGESRFKRPS